MENNLFLNSAIKQFESYKSLGDKTFAQLSDENLFWQFNEESNSIAIIIRHMAGNMISRWTDFLTTDGEKTWRKRENEFENKIISRHELLNIWEEGWNCLFNTLKSLTDNDLQKIIKIRNQPQPVMDAIHRQLAHYPYHIGQIVHIGKMLSNNNWQSLSIPKGKSDAYNSELFLRRSTI
jgi:Protein of unknown function (DUF1572)